MRRSGLCVVFYTRIYHSLLQRIRSSFLCLPRLRFFFPWQEFFFSNKINRRGKKELNNATGISRYFSFTLFRATSVCAVGIIDGDDNDIYSAHTHTCGISHGITKNRIRLLSVVFLWKNDVIPGLSTGKRQGGIPVKIEIGFGGVPSGIRFKRKFHRNFNLPSGGC